MVGRMLLYGWRFNVGQHLSNEQINVGPSKINMFGFWLAMVSMLAGLAR